eukprot:scaffold8459_cov267-Pinguiococcus_pyrenoidosus.AAC.6
METALSFLTARAFCLMLLLSANSAGSTAGADTSFSAAAGANAGANTVANIGVTDGTGTGGSQAFSIGNAEVPQSASAQSEYAATTTTSSGSTSSAAGLTAGVETSSMGSNSAPQEVFASTPSTCKLGCLADDKTCNDYGTLPCPSSSAGRSVLNRLSCSPNWTDSERQSAPMRSPRKSRYKTRKGNPLLCRFQAMPRANLK